MADNKKRNARTLDQLAADVTALWVEMDTTTAAAKAARKKSDEAETYYEKIEKQLGKTGGDKNRGCADEHSETQFNESESGFPGIGEAWSEARLRGRLLQ